jgi:tetratricopeptide (TPR) repeat protein
LFYQFRRDGRAAQARGEATIELVAEHGVSPLWWAYGTLVRGWALAEQGEAEEGIAHLRHALDVLQTAGFHLMRPYHLGLLAEALGKAGRAPEGRAVLAKALAMAHQTGERCCEAELYRLQGELILEPLEYGVASPEAEAEACFIRAIDISRSQGARLFELRAVMSLAHLRMRQGKKQEARMRLAEVYGWFHRGLRYERPAGGPGAAGALAWDGFVMQLSIAKRAEPGAPSIRELHSRGSKPAIGLCVVGLTLGSVCAEDRALEEIHPTATLLTITVEARPPAFDPAFETNSITVLDRDMLARSEERALNGALRGLPGVILQSPGQRGNPSSLFVRGASAGLGQLSFDGVPLYSLVNGIFNLSAVPVDALERVEIVRGASGPRYGSRAFGGVIRLQSRDAPEDGGFLPLEGGSYGTLSETVGGALRGAKARTTVTASRDDVFEDISMADPRNGNSERDGFRTTQGIARLSLF